MIQTKESCKLADVVVSRDKKLLHLCQIGNGFLAWGLSIKSNEIVLRSSEELGVEHLV